MDLTSFLNNGLVIDDEPAAPAPIVETVDPTFGIPGGLNLLDVFGEFFVDGAVIDIIQGATVKRATFITFLSDLQMRCNMPSGTVGPATVRVTNPDGQNSGLSGLNIYQYSNS